MGDRRPCIRCGRTIDDTSKLCPFCNWDQAVAYSPENEPVVQRIQAPRPEANPLKRYALIGAGLILLLIVSFFLGYLINRDGTPKEAPAPVTTGAKQTESVPAPRAATTALVPMTEGIVEEPITSAPSAPGQPPDAFGRADATAVSSAEYAQLAARARAENSQAVDPRSITGAAFAGGTPPAMAPTPRQRTLATRRTAAATPPATPASVPGAAVKRTRPSPEYQPLPDIRVSRDTTARLELMVGPDGRVSDVNVIEGVPGQTPRIIAAVQAWRFRPATENGVPVAAPFSVDISFNGRD